MKGSTRQRGKTWTALWPTTDSATGKRHQASKGGFRTKKLAEAHLNGILEKVEQGTWRPDAKLTVEQLLTEWLAAKRSEGLRENTISMYTNVAKGWVVPHIGAVDVRKLTPAAVGRLVEELRANGSRRGRGALSDRSVQLAVTILKAATRWAWQQGLMGRDILASYKRPKVQPTDRVATAWTADEAGMFLAAATHDRLRAAWWLLLTRGLRRGELCGLRWQDIDLEAGRARIVHTRVVVNSKAQVSDPKTNAGRRSVSLDATLVAELRAHRIRQIEERLRAGEAWADTGYLFTDELGCPVSPDTLSGRFDAQIAKAGVRRVRLHDGRHSAATLMLEGGEPVHTVAQILGHSKPSITLDVYAHAIDRGGELAGERLTALLAQRARR